MVVVIRAKKKQIEYLLDTSFCFPLEIKQWNRTIRWHLPGLIISLSKDSDQLLTSSMEGLKKDEMMMMIIIDVFKEDTYGSPRSIVSTGWRPSSVRTVRLKARKQAINQYIFDDQYLDGMAKKRKKKKKNSRRKNFLFVRRYFFGPARIRRTFSGKTKTRCSRTLFPIVRVDRWSSSDVDLCLIDRAFVDADVPPAVAVVVVVVVLMKCLFGIDMVDADALLLPFSCTIFISDDVDIDVWRCWWLFNEHGERIERLVNVDAEWDVPIWWVVGNRIDDDFDGDSCEGEWGDLFDVSSVSHVTVIALIVAELERCGRTVGVLWISLWELRLPLPPSWARATCSGTTWVISGDVLEVRFVVISNDSGCQWSGHETRLEKSCWCDDNEDDDDGGCCCCCCSDSMVHRCRRQEKLLLILLFLLLLFVRARARFRRCWDDDDSNSQSFPIIINLTTTGRNNTSDSDMFFFF